MNAHEDLSLNDQIKDERIMIRLTAYISGRVQRTGYRARVVSLAKEMSIVGFVQNRPEEVGERLDDGIEILKELVVGVNNLTVGLNNLTTITKDGFENINGKMDQMLDKQDDTIEEIQGLREDTMRRSDAKLSRIEKDIRLIKNKVGIS
jgi:acylphosphatase